MLNIALLFAVSALATVAVGILTSPRNSRRCAAWLLAKAYEAENLSAERRRWRDLAEQRRLRHLVEFGLARECPSCRGVVFDLESHAECSECRGSGVVDVREVVL